MVKSGGVDRWDKSERDDREESGESIESRSSLWDGIVLVMGASEEREGVQEAYQASQAEWD